MDQISTQQISGELVAILGTHNQVVPFSQRYEGFDLPAAYEVVSCVKALRVARGETSIGRKVGFTNRHIWETFGVSAPVWNYVYDRTVHEANSVDSSFPVSGLPEPLIEPELVLHLSMAPESGMGELELLACVDWVAAGFEIVHSIFPDWKFSAADGAAAYGMHSALVIGSKASLPADSLKALAVLREFSVKLSCDTGDHREGHASDVLGGPLKVLGHLADEITRYPASQPLQAGEIVTTGTLTEAMPALPGSTWTTHFDGIEMEPLQLRLE